MQKTTRIALLAFAALSAPVAAHAQTTPAAPAPAPAAPAQDEAASIQQQLQGIQQRAMQDPALQAEAQAFSRDLLAIMTRLDPAVTQKTARATALRQEVAAAQQAGDNARLNQLATEAQELQAYFTTARERALTDSAGVARQQAFKEKVVEAMRKTDPRTDTLLARLDELQKGSAPAAPAQGGTAPAGAPRQ
ncbi:MAG TPA: hypothetical protein VFQ39_16125 [Longimicrobium sp.]|nr:hypothetical protein [Longimicrobium sp.]